MKILKVKCLAPTRLDHYLQQQYPALTPGRLNKALRENKIKLNGKKQPLSTRVAAGDEIKLFILDEQLEDSRSGGPAWQGARAEAEAVYNGPHLLVVNKPAGLPVDGPDGDTLLRRALLYLHNAGEYGPDSLYQPALCHRLDTGTSGLVLIAKTPEAEQMLLEAIKERQVKKTYLCVTFGRPVPPAGTLGGYLLKDAALGKVQITKAGRQGGLHRVRDHRGVGAAGPFEGAADHRADPSDPGPHGQHRLPHPGGQQVRQQRRQPGAQAEVPGPLRLGAAAARLRPRQPPRRRQGFPRAAALVLQPGSGRHAKINLYAAKSGGPNGPPLCVCVYRRSYTRSTMPS